MYIFDKIDYSLKLMVVISELKGRDMISVKYIFIYVRMLVLLCVYFLIVFSMRVVICYRNWLISNVCVC